MMGGTRPLVSVLNSSLLPLILVALIVTTVETSAQHTASLSDESHSHGFTAQSNLYFRRLQTSVGAGVSAFRRAMQQQQHKAPIVANPVISAHAVSDNAPSSITPVPKAIALAAQDRTVTGNVLALSSTRPEPIPMAAQREVNSPPQMAGTSGLVKRPTGKPPATPTAKPASSGKVTQAHRQGHTGKVTQTAPKRSPKTPPGTTTKRPPGTTTKQPTGSTKKQPPSKGPTAKPPAGKQPAGKPPVPKQPAGKQPVGKNPPPSPAVRPPASLRNAPPSADTSGTNFQGTQNSTSLTSAPPPPPPSPSPSPPLPSSSPPPPPPSPSATTLSPSPPPPRASPPPFSPRPPPPSPPKGWVDRSFDKYMYFPDWCKGRENCQHFSNGTVQIAATNGTSTSIGSFISKYTYKYGIFSLRMKLPSNYSGGIIPCFYLISPGPQNYHDIHDEIDFEFIGDVAPMKITIHTNLISGGQNYLEQFAFPFDPAADFHTYKIIYSPFYIMWMIDDIPIRITYNKPEHPFPSMPVEFKASIWDSSSWSWLKANYSNGPHTSQYNAFDFTHTCQMPADGADPKCLKLRSSRHAPWLAKPTKQHLRKHSWFRKNYLTATYPWKSTHD